MTGPDLLSVFEAVLTSLEKVSVDYMVVGSVASMIYGEPRLTKDMDVVIEVQPTGMDLLYGAFPEKDYYVPPKEILQAEITARGQFNLIHHASGLKIDLIIRKNSPHAIEEFQRRQKKPFGDRFDAFVAAPEDVIIKKLGYFREGGSEKHLNDIRGILAHTEIDRSYLERWIRDLGLGDIWRRI